MKQIEVELLRPNSKMPVRAHSTDAGMDVFVAFDDPELQPIYITPGENRILGTGLKINIPEGYVLEVKNRSSIASKRSLIVGAHIIDSGYQGEIFIDLHNIGYNRQWIDDGDKIAQLLCYPIVTPQPKMVENAFDNDTERGEGGFGSTNDTNS